MIPVEQIIKRALDREIGKAWAVRELQIGSRVKAGKIMRAMDRMKEKQGLLSQGETKPVD